MEERLNEVARIGNIDLLYDLIRQDPCMLDRVDESPFVETPLHVAAMAGNVRFAIEMMRLKPSFSRKLNPDGFAPIHTALQSGHGDLVIRMINVDRELVRVQGKECNTPLHFVADQEGNVELMVELLLACPESILDVNVRKETALHIAVKNNKIDTVKVMLEWLKLLDSVFVMGWTDEESNTILHIAASRNYIQMVKMLIPKTDLYARNSRGLQALDTMDAQARTMLQKDRKLKIARWWVQTKSYDNETVFCDTNNNSSLVKSLKKGFPWYKRWIFSNHRIISLADKNGILVVAVLIATNAYQAVITLPTIFDNQFIAASSHYYLFIFQLFNAATFIAAMSLIQVLLPRGVSYSVQLIMPIIVCYFVGIYLPNLEGQILLFTLALFVFQLLWHGRLDTNGNRRDRHSLLKHSASFSKELERKGYRYQ
ncbi:hypothetical protein DCAR_0729172 [Daucus carota subsp. sativus]|uniref:Uncharacterized protein n=2 Tax=Daucus carota subsp. sativus TaxID=79200 RepID=A0A175YIG8_DAUCS|nr:hypothetical protein DCAR_0729172 [Daucus carota subsp. sativus]